MREGLLWLGLPSLENITAGAQKKRDCNLRSFSELHFSLDRARVPFTHNCSWHGYAIETGATSSKTKSFSPPLCFIISPNGEEVAQFSKEICKLSADQLIRLSGERIGRGLRTVALKFSSSREMEYINKLLHRAAAIPTRALSPTPPGGNDNSVGKTAEHEVKVRFAREFADVGSVGYSAAESLSSASSFQSLSSSHSAKSSSGACLDSAPQSPDRTLDKSYANSSILGVEDLILGCADLQINEETDHSFNTLQSSQDLSQDQTFTSATDEPVADFAEDISSDSSAVNLRKVSQILENDSTSQEIAYASLNSTQDARERPILVVPSSNDVEAKESNETSISPSSCNRSENSIDDLETSYSFTVPNDAEEIPLPDRSAESSNLNSTVCLSAGEADLVDASETKEEFIVQENVPIETDLLPRNLLPSSPINAASLGTVLIEHVEEPSLPTLSTLSSLIATDFSIKLGESDARDSQDDSKILPPASSSPVRESSIPVVESSLSVSKSPGRETADRIETVSSNVYDATIDGESRTNLLNDIPAARSETVRVDERSSCTDIPPEVDANDTSRNSIELPRSKVDNLEVNVPLLDKKEEGDNKLDGCCDASGGSNVVENTDAINSTKEEENLEEREEQSSGERLDTTLTFQDVSLNLETVPEVDRYTEFKPQRQSTTLDLPIVDQPNFVELKTAAEQVANDIFKSSLEFSEESDPFISATSEIFQDPTSFDFLIAHGNSNAVNRLRAESLYVKFDPLVSDIDMLPQGNAQPINEERNGKNDSASPNIDTPKRNPAIAAIDRLLFYSPISTSMTQKMEEPREKIEQAPEEPKSESPIINDVDVSKELVLVRVTVLQLEEELEKQKKQYEADLERQMNSFQERINKLQAQIAQEVKSKSQMTVVVEEYEKSISRLLTERERDRTNFEQEKAKLQEELQATNIHLANTEAAFNDVHQKYERLKGVVTVYKNNEMVLKESIQENMETIKSLETRYDDLKNHAMAELEKANFELEAMRKQHEDETVKLHAMVRKAELKSNSLADLVEQKTRENKELTQILDEVIARVGHQDAE